MGFSVYTDNNPQDRLWFTIRKMCLNLVPCTSVWSPSMLQTLHHHHPHPKGIQNYSNVCGHEVMCWPTWRTLTGPSLDPLQFAYRGNRSVDDTVNMGLHYVLQHLDRPGAYVRNPFVDFSSAFIIPNLSMPTSICQWINSFLTDRQQIVRLGNSHPAPVRSALELLGAVISLYKNDCTSKYPSVKLLKFGDDTTPISLIQDGDESAYRPEVKERAVWCSLNNLELNTLKTVAFRRTAPPPPPPPPPSPFSPHLSLPTHHHEQLCDSSGVIQIPEIFTWTPLWKRPSRGCTSFASWGSSTCPRSCWNSSTQPLLNPSSAHQ